jgi:hypothetical protein
MRNTVSISEIGEVRLVSFMTAVCGTLETSRRQEDLQIREAVSKG